MATNVILLARQGMNVATWNVNGIRARASQVREWLGRERPDVVCLQELKAEPAQIPEECRLAEYHAYWHGRKGYSGVSLLIRKELLAGDPLYSHPPFDVESRIVQVELGRLVIASVYVPNGGKDYPAKLNFLTRLTDWARQLHAEGRALFEALLGTGLADLGRAFDPDNDGLFTWWAPWRNLRARNIGWRLDYMLASPTVAARASACVVEADVGTSDHAPVVMTTV